MDIEADYQMHHCSIWGGQVEVRLEDATRVDCITADYAIEFDWCHKWAEAIGQALHYSKLTGKPPAIALICKSTEQRFIKRVNNAIPNDPEIRIFIINRD